MSGHERIRPANGASPSVGVIRTVVPRLVINAPDDLHLLSLLVRERLEGALETVEGRDLARRLEGRVGLAAGEMRTTLAFEPGRIQLIQGEAEEARARATGTLSSFLAICHGKVRFSDVLRRQVHISGNLLMLRRFLPLLSMGIRDEHE